MINKSLSADGQGCVLSLLLGLRPNYGEGNKDNSDLLPKVHACTAILSVPNPAAGHHQPTPLLETPGHSRKSGSVSCGVTAPFSWVLVHKVLFMPSKSLFPSPV